MRRPGCAATTAALLSAALGCASSTDPPPGITSVLPTRSFNDLPLSLTIRGGPFRAAYRIDTSSGSGSLDTSGFSAFLSPVPPGSSTGLERVTASQVTWQDTTTLLVELPARITVGVYDVDVRDPRGNVASLPHAFLSLGADTSAPLVVVDRPIADSVLGGGATVSGVFHADDGDGLLASLHWSVSYAGLDRDAGDCSVSPPGGYSTCSFSFIAPNPLSAVESLVIDAQAVDSRGNSGSTQVVFGLARPPTVISLTPTIGSAAGNTQLSVEGADFVVPVAPDIGTQIMIDGRPIPTTVASSTLIMGMTEAHDPGAFSVSVQTGGAGADAGIFTFVARPIVRAIRPTVGSAAGGTPVAIVGNYFRRDVTQVFFDDQPLRCPSFVSDNRIDGYAPAGSASATVRVTDPIGGEGTQAAGYTYGDATSGDLPLDAGCPDGGGGS